MKKKLLSVLLCAAMTVSMLAGCGSNQTAEPTTAPTEAPADPTKAPDPTATPTPAPTEAPAPAGEALPEARYYFPFEDATGATVKVNDLTGTTTDTRIIDTDKTLYHTNGVVGQCAWFDGKYGLELDVEPLDSDTWTISFWLNASRLATYGATITFGSDFYSENASARWINITRTEFDGATYPTIWSRDEAANIWPWFNYATDVEAGKKEWAHVVLVSDENNWTEDGLFINADLYVNGEYVDKECQLTPGIFGADDTFHFLLGINCWDTIYKGAMDELYIFDEALTAGQVATLYAQGDTSKQPVNPVEESDVRDHSDVTLSRGKMVGALDYTSTIGSSYSDVVAVPADGVPVIVEFDNYTRGESFDDTYAVILQNVAAGHSVEDNAAYAEHAVLYGTITKNTAFESYLVKNTFNQFDPKKFGDDTDRAKITMTLVNNGTTVDVSIQALCADGVTRFLEYAGIPVNGEVFCCLTTQGGFLDTVPNIKTYGTVLGSVDFTTGWWAAHSEAVQVPVGETVTTRLVNYSVGNAVYQNWVAVLKNVAGLNETEGYTEYAVVRADNYGWGVVGYEGNPDLVAVTDWGVVSGYTETPEDAAWLSGHEAEYIADMNGATVDVAVTNHGSKADVVATITTKSGKVFTQKYLNIIVTGDLYYGFTTDSTCLDIIGTFTGKDIVGVDNNSAGWWTFHSEPVAVPAGESVTTKFINYTSGANNWNNYLVVLQNVPAAHGAADDAAYAEYAVMRADNWGWGAGFDNIVVKETDFDWSRPVADCAADMNGATVELTITNNGTTADVVAVVTTVAGTVYTQKYTGVAVSGDLYYCLTTELGWLDILE